MLAPILSRGVGVVTLALAALTGACGGKEQGSGGATSSSSSSGTGAGGSAPVLDPALFDCTAKASPERSSPVPAACVADVGCKTKMISGHRGAGGDLGIVAPEDTVSAVRAAIAFGIEFDETDPRPTKDGYIVNVHDTDVSRVTYGTGNVADMTLAELQALKLRTSQYAGDFSCEHIATLEEILTAAKGRIHVLVDANKTDRVDLLVKAIETTGTVEWAIFDTSDDAKIDTAIALEPKILTMIRAQNPTELATKLDHFKAHPPIIVEVEDPVTDAMVQAVLAANQRPFTDVFVVDALAAISNDPSGYQTVLDQGFQILQTERPDLVKRAFGR
jgi:glycerophosphoryl diester phosphodiesterase